MHVSYIQFSSMDDSYNSLATQLYIFMQGRLCLSARLIGFHSELFGHKTKFLFLWEDIETIQVFPPTFSSMVSPIIVMTLRLGRGLDAKHGAKTHDAEGRLKFHFSIFRVF